MSDAARATPPRRFRRRLLASLLLVGLAPLVAMTVFANVVIERLTQVDLGPVESALERAGGHLERRGGDAAVLDELRRAQLNVATVQLARPRLFSRVRLAFAAIVVVAAGALVGMGVVLWRGLSRPIEELATGMWRFSRGDIGHRVAETAAPKPDELQLLVRQFNRMGDDLEAQRRRLAEAEKLAAWQDVARALAHDLGNPLTAMRMAVARLGRAPSTEATAESLALLDEELGVLLRMTQSFSDFAKLPEPRRQRVHLTALVREEAALYAEGGLVGVALGELADVTVQGDGDQLRRALGNLIKNATEASRPGDAPVKVSLDRRGERAVVQVTDAGPGISRARQGGELARSLGSSKAGGSGLGLPLAFKIAHGHGGTLGLAPRSDGASGTVASLELPLGDATEARA